MELEGVGRLMVRWQVGQEETVENQVERQCAWTVHPRTSKQQVVRDHKGRGGGR